MLLIVAKFKGREIEAEGLKTLASPAPQPLSFFFHLPFGSPKRAGSGRDDKVYSENDSPALVGSERKHSRG
jgi:hypothetical protein